MAASVFQSTRPLRGETFNAREVDGQLVFSIHSPLAGRDQGIHTPLHDSSFFNPLAPCGARPDLQNAIDLLTGAFQSTRPLRGETCPPSPARRCRSFFNPLAPCGARQQTITKIVCKRYSCCTVHFPTNPPRGASGRKTGCASRKTGIHLVRTYREFGVYCRFASQDQRFIHRKDG